MLIIGHRGAAGWEDENTIASFRRAMDFGVDMIEMDVHLCAGGELIVIHDETLNRTSDGRGYVAEAPLDRIRACKTRRGHAVPTLMEALDAIDRRVGVNIELKGKRTAEAVAGALPARLKQGWRLADFLISSFDPEALRRFQRIHPDVRTGLVVKALPDDLTALAGELKLESVNVHFKQIDASTLRALHDQGWKVYVWTVNDPADIRRMKALGVDGIFTDYPDRAIPVSAHKSV